MKFDVKTVLLLVVIAFLAFMYVDSCKSKNEAIDQAIGFADYKDTAMTYKDRYNKEVTYNAAMVLSERNAFALIDTLKDNLRRLKLRKPSSITIIRTELRVDSVPIPFTDSIPCDSFTYTTVVDSPHYVIDLTLTERSLTFNSLLIPNKQSIIVGTKKNGFFRKNEYVATVENSNPYMNIIGLQQYTIKTKKRWYEKWYVQGAVGFAVGWTIRQQILRTSTTQ